MHYTIPITGPGEIYRGYNKMGDRKAFKFTAKRKFALKIQTFDMFHGMDQVQGGKVF